MKTLHQTRQSFLNYFKSQGHEIVPSSGLVPKNDPTLMFTSAGMVQFKNLFTGQEKRPYVRAATSQKCLRAGGKHNDLENVGFTNRHHTFFEMLGNFSFGDYFKDDAIKFAWDVMTKEFGLPREKLLVTVYHTDDEAANIWKKVAGLSDDRIIRIATSDNFWSAGDTGPCGPCTEIFYDHGDHLFGGPPGSKDEDGDRFIEVWNLVFMQYETLADGTRVNLPKPSIDTGCGLERISAVLQGTNDNYNVDVIRAIIEASAHFTSQAPDGPFKISHRVIADHLRASCFMIADGILPSNEGRGYVLRRIMRRAMRHAHLLGTKDVLMYRLVPTLIAQMGDVYPELKTAEALMTETLKTEEARFKKTLANGLALLNEETARLGTGQPLSGDVAFKLYDTYGFPLDLTQDVLKREQARSVDVAGFDSAMQKQKEAARKAWSGSGEAATDSLWFSLKEKISATEFLGYDSLSAEGLILAIIDDKGQSQNNATAGAKVKMIFNQTPFYAEAGGQIGDRGLIKGVGGQAKVSDCQKKLGLFIHELEVMQGSFAVGESVSLQVDEQYRNDIRANHSATHLLNAALRRHVGAHVAQKGSLVDAERLRFDISQPVALTEAQITAVEHEVNERIRGNSNVSTRLMGIDEARTAGAVAMFGEKYDEEVRVLAMGGVDETAPSGIYSMELCGGTHVSRTGDIGLFKITAESAVSAGVRRIEAVTGRGALAYFTDIEKKFMQIATELKAAPAEIETRVHNLIAERKKLEKEVAELRRKLATAGTDSGTAQNDVKDVKGIAFSGRVLEGMPASDLKPLADALKAKLNSAVIALVAVNEGKASLVVAVTDDLTVRISAVDLVKSGAEILGGKGGGGRPDMAQAGGPNGAAAHDALAAIEKALMAKVA